MTRSGPRELFEASRLLAFSDGVFAVAITLLVIDLRLPPVPAGNEDTALLQALLDMWPKLAVFVFTFLILGMSWLGHHRKFSHIDKVDGRLLWLNLLYLLALCLVPFASSVLGEHGRNRFAFTLYAGVMALTELLAAALSGYGLREPFLAGRSEPRPDLWRDMVLSPMLVGALFVIGAVLAMVGLARPARWTLIVIVPVMAFFGSRARERAAVPNN